MSHHFYGYGQNPGQPPPPGAYPYQQQTSYLPPSFNPPYDPSGAPYNAHTIESHYNVSQNSYDYNAGRIPGLGISGSQNAPMGSPFNAPPGINPWASSAMLQSSPPATGLQNYPAQRNSHGMPTQYGPSSSTPSKPTSATAALSASGPAKNKPQNQDDLEEGELSEGQFEDLYDSKDSRAPGSVRASPSQPGNKLSSPDDLALQSGLVHPTSNAEQAEADLYGVSEEEGEIPEDNQQMDTDSQRSSSYSPVLAAKEVRNNNNIPSRPEDSASTSLSLPLPGIALAENAAHSSASPTSTNTRQEGEMYQLMLGSFRTFEQARKEAKAAVLCLLQLGIKFQDYIDEGFDENVMKGIFAELGLNVTQTSRPGDDPGATTLASIKENPQEKSLKKLQETLQGKLQEKLQVAEPLSDTPSSSAEAAAKPEARNERIARLLAAHSKKAATTVTAPKPPPEEPKPNQSSQESLLPTASTKSKGASDMNLLLHQKMAALRKQKSSQATPSPTPQDAAIAAAPPSRAGMAGGSLGAKAPLTAPASASDTQGSHSPSGQAPSQAKTAVPENREEDPQQQQVQPDQSRPSPSSPIPGVVPLGTQNPAPNGRKRPVASDFDDYSTTVGPPKRPYHLETQDTTFVIDVSDGSDDEDMAMDTDDDTPPGDGPSAQFRHAAGGKGLSLGDFPPLTNTKRSHDSGSSTPNVSKNGQKQMTELERKEESIQQMKQKIAMFEAQAKQKAINKSSSGSQTPKQAAGTPTPDPKDGERDVLRSGSAPTLGSSNARDSSPGQPTSGAGALPVLKRVNSSNVARLRNKARAERRGRIVSLDLPRLSRALMEKQERLKNLREEETRLQAEIDSKMAEQNALTEELSQLESEPLEGAVQHDGADLSITTTEPVVQIDRAPTEMRTSGPSDKPPQSPESLSSGDISMAEDSSDGRYHSQEAEDSQLGRDIDTEARRHRGVSASRGVARGLEQANSSPPLEDSKIASRDESPAPTELQETSPAGRHGPSTYDSGETSDAVLIDESPAAASPSSPLAVVEPSSSHADSAEQVDDPEQISVVTAPRRSEQELEQGDIGETSDKPTSKPDATSFVPYQSPLGYFRAYRFHPEYKASVAGGWSSLTYSSKIEADNEICPYDLDDKVCPLDDCKYNHFKSMLPADDKIVLELGSSDEFTGDEKRRFKDGLRELLNGFRVHKVKDFSRIAQAIVEYRAGFLGDRFKVLNLHGVVL